MIVDLSTIIAYTGSQMQQGKLNQQLAQSLHRLVWLIDQTTDQVLRSQVGIGLSQYAILSNLAQSNSTGLSQQAIADYLGIDKAAISRQVVKLIQDKLLERAPNPNSRREYVLSLTPEGSQAVTLARQALGETMTPHFMAAGKERATMLLDTVNAISSSLENNKDK